MLYVHSQSPNHIYFKSHFGKTLPSLHIRISNFVRNDFVWEHKSVTGLCYYCRTLYRYIQLCTSKLFMSLKIQTLISWYICITGVCNHHLCNPEFEKRLQDQRLSMFTYFTTYFYTLCISKLKDSPLWYHFLRLCPLVLSPLPSCLWWCLFPHSHLV